jgi:hypothetical protein
MAGPRQSLWWISSCILLITISRAPAVYSICDDARSLNAPPFKRLRSAHQFELPVPREPASVLAMPDPSADLQLVADDLTILCQRWDTDGLLKRRIMISQDRCQDQWVNAQTNEVVKTADSPCNDSC